MTSGPDDAGRGRPQRIGRWRIDGVLGSGAMGVVYAGYDEAIERKVAIKTIQAELLNGADVQGWLDRFRQEVRAAGRCQHPNIVTVYDYGEQDGIPYLVMEYVPGRSLRDCLKERSSMPPSAAVAIVAGVLRGLELAHEAGVVHRDIKPGNIIVLPDGQVKVTDFGIARLDTPLGLTQVGSLLGTPGYMAPEQLQGRKADMRGDLFAVGVVLYELLAGLHPFHGADADELIRGQLEDTPRPPSRWNGAVPRDLDPIVARALAKNPEQRFQSAAEFLAALKNLNFTEDGSIPRGEELATVLVSGTQGSPRTLNTGATIFDPALLQRVTAILAEVLGPMSAIMVRREAQRAKHLAELTQALLALLPAEADRPAFARRIRAATGETRFDFTANATSAAPVEVRTSALPTALEPAVLDAAARDLAAHLGPIAKILVRKAAARARTAEELYGLLAEHIAAPAERAAFLKQGARGTR